MCLCVCGGGGGYSYIDLETVLQPAKKGKGPSINKEDLEKCLRAEFKLQVFFFYKSSFKKSMFEMYILPLKKVSCHLKLFIINLFVH